MFTEARRELIDWVRRQLIGPIETANSDGELRGARPTERFPCGALYPVTPWGDGVDPSSEDAETENDELEDGEGKTTAQAAVLRRYIPPSSLGFSFFIRGDDIQLQVMYHAVSYRYKRRHVDTWQRKALMSNHGETEETIVFRCPGRNTHEIREVLDDRARVDVLWRRFGDGWIVTVSFSNGQEMAREFKRDSFHIDYEQKTLFETRLRCVIDSGTVGEYPRADAALLDEEEQEIELQYAHKSVHAVGHGCAVDWAIADGHVTEIYSETMPAVEVPMMTADTSAVGDDTLSLKRLASFDTAHESLTPKLERFIEGYADWIEQQSQSLAALLPAQQPAGQRLVERMRNAVQRMHSGLQLLTEDAEARLAFALANRVMLDQMRQGDHVRGKNVEDKAYRWRPFQLAFLLSTLESAANQDSEHRDTVDLIWFPTGGGKTEAYLGLTAFLILLRRLRHPDTGGGTTIMMRYTLRLLTRDQFMRATRLICALELLRRQRGDLGPEIIDIGMWVGDATSPNHFRKAVQLVERARPDASIPGLVLEHCPWCGSGFTASKNYDAGKDHFHFVCSNNDCDFVRTGDGRLPCHVVDETLYKKAPTMLVSTVDKFARLAWEERSHVFFGGKKHRPPELIIQDELHLIASALGSVAGLYEAAIDTVLQLRGVYPKYIASTATIRMAGQQVRRLYGREVAIFPPSGLSHEDSYFARTVALSERPGRIYVGYLAPMLKRTQSLTPLAAALLLAPIELFSEHQDADELLDAWWTQVLYHGSLRGVGNSHTALASSVRDFMRLLGTTTDNSTAPPDYPQGSPEERTSDAMVLRDDPTPASRQHRQRPSPVVAQLTSLQSAEENAQIFARLAQRRGEDGVLDAVLATNMISVGLDVGRLALMVVNGQPLTTAEYIQASSRVGRSDVPGLVFMNYYRTQARSLSHYESFRPYHEAFYRFVEPTSVTPYTYQARLRALHAALVIVMRHAGLGLRANDKASHFDPERAEIAHAIQKLKERCAKSEPELADESSQHIDRLIEEWRLEIERCETARRKLEYRVPDREMGRDRLLCNHDDRIQGLWPTLNSMRNVENTALLKPL